jgi:hypothetical protein
MPNNLISSPPQTDDGYYDYTGLSKEEVLFRTKEGWNGPLVKDGETLKKSGFGSSFRPFTGGFFGSGPTNSECPLAMIGVSNYSANRMDIEKFPSVFNPRELRFQTGLYQTKDMVCSVWRDDNTVWDIANKYELPQSLFGDRHAVGFNENGFPLQTIEEAFSFANKVKVTTLGTNQFNLGVSFWLKGSSGSGVGAWGGICHIAETPTDTDDFLNIRYHSTTGTPLRIMVNNNQFSPTIIPLAATAVYDGNWHNWQVLVNFYGFSPYLDVFVYRDNTLYTQQTGLDCTNTNITHGDDLYFYQPLYASGAGLEPAFMRDLRLYTNNNTSTILDSTQRSDIYRNFLPVQLFQQEDLSVPFVTYSGAGQLAELFTEGHDTSTGNVDLFMQCDTVPSSDIPLYIAGDLDQILSTGILAYDKVWPIEPPLSMSLANKDSIWSDGLVAFWNYNEGAGHYSYNNAWSQHQGTFLRGQHRTWYYDTNPSQSGRSDTLEPAWDYDSDMGRFLSPYIRTETTSSGTKYNFDYVELNNYSGGIDCTGAMTLDVWVRPLPSSVAKPMVYGPIISFNSSGGYDLRLIPSHSGATEDDYSIIRFAVNGHTYGDIISGGEENNIPFNRSTWHNIVAVVEVGTGTPLGSGSGSGSGESGIELMAPPRWVDGKLIFGGVFDGGAGPSGGDPVITPGSGDARMKLYLDGRLISEGLCTLPIRYQYTESPRIGKEGTEGGVDNYDFGSEEFFYGGLKNLRIYRDRQFAAEEVWGNYVDRRAIYKTYEMNIPFSGYSAGTQSKGLDLFIRGANVVSEDLNLYIHGGPGTIYESSIPLYLKAHVNFPGSQDLYLRAIGETGEDLNLWIGGFDRPSEFLPLNMIAVPSGIGCGQVNELYLKVFGSGGVSDDLNLHLHCSSTPINSSVPLHITGDEFYNWVKDVPLYIHPVYQELWIRGYDVYNEDLNLYINSSDDYDNWIPLVISTIEKGGFDLWTKGFEASAENINLFLQSNPIVPLSDSSDLIMVGSTNNGFFAGFDLFTKVPASEAEDFQDMNLFLLGASSISFNDNMNLWISGGMTELGSAADLYVNNSISGVTNTVDLWITAPGGREGFVPLEESMNLFINTAIGSWTPIYMSGDVYRISGNKDLYLEAKAGSGSGNKNLVLPDTYDVGTKTGNLFIRGW